MTQVLYTYLDKESHELLMARFLPDFPKHFQEKILRYKRWEDAQLTLLGRILLKIGLKTNQVLFSESDLTYSAYNKPTLKDSNIEFNISHSGEIVICAITAENEIGIDIEKMYDIDINDFRSQMTSEEWHEIVSAKHPKPAFFDFWTQKEAVVKANGMGLSTPLKDFKITNNRTHLKHDFFLTEIQIDPDYKCYLAFKNRLDLQIQKPQLIKLRQLV